MFAVDSIPAVLAISTDPLIVFSSNIFAILGLRALYFVLQGFMKLFHYLHYGLTLILMFIGVKMLISDIFKIPTAIALAVLGLILTVSIVASLIWPAKDDKIPAGDHP
jgi:tellurite resistance protein TerC